MELSLAVRRPKAETWRHWAELALALLSASVKISLTKPTGPVAHFPDSQYQPGRPPMADRRLPKAANPLFWPDCRQFAPIGAVANDQQRRGGPDSYGAI